MSDIEWADPPPTNHSRSRRADEIKAMVAQLKERPRQWALVCRGMRSSGSVVPWQRHGCEVALRKTCEGTWDIYARWPE